MLLKLDEIGRLFDVPEKDVLQWVRKEGLPATVIDDQYQVNRMDLLEWATGRQMTIPSHFLVGAGARSDLAALPSLRAAIEAGGVHYDVPGDDKESALRNVVSLLPLPAGVDPAFILDVLLARESLGATAVGNGIAIPHVRNPILLHVKRPFVSLFLLEHPVDFGAIDGKPVHALFVVVAPSVPVHLRVLAQLGHVLRDAGLRALLAERASAERILGRVRELEGSSHEASAG